jgi:tryptophan-rich sensory protein
MPGIINMFWLPQGIATDWYINLSQFPFNPNIYVFAIMWSAVHVLLGIGLYLVFKKREETPNTNKALSLFLTDVVLSAVWPFILFKQHIIGFSTVVSVGLIIIAYFMQKSFARENKYAGYIVWLYIIWLIFALYLNLGLLLLN